jgi:hypothetical protein
MRREPEKAEPAMSGGEKATTGDEANTQSVDSLGRTHTTVLAVAPLVYGFLNGYETLIQRYAERVMSGFQSWLCAGPESSPPRRGVLAGVPLEHVTLRIGD